jgi:GNAT superfamily N-acetyltransferase
MQDPVIRSARPDECDAVASLWMESWVSTGLDRASEALLSTLRARVPHEMASGWSLFVADDKGRLAAMLALNLPLFRLDQLFVGPDYQGRSLGRRLMAFTRTLLPDEICLRCARENEKAWRWYEREGFVFEHEAFHAATERMMKYYRWKKEGNRP